MKIFKLNQFIKENNIFNEKELNNIIDFIFGGQNQYNDLQDYYDNNSQNQTIIEKNLIKLYNELLSYGFDLNKNILYNFLPLDVYETEDYELEFINDKIMNEFIFNVLLKIYGTLENDGEDADEDCYSVKTYIKKYGLPQQIKLLKTIEWNEDTYTHCTYLILSCNNIKYVIGDNRDSDNFFIAIQS